MAASTPDDRYAVHDALEEVAGYRHTRWLTGLSLALAAVALLVDPHHVLLWLAVCAVLLSQWAYRRAVSTVLIAPTTKRVRGVTLHGARHSLLLLVNGVLSLAAVVIATETGVL